MWDSLNDLFVDPDGKPDSLPRNWPFPDAEDILERPKRLINVGSEQDYHFKNNFVKTSKYEIYNFVPKFLMEEFNPKTKFANCYFLLVACLQTIEVISNTGGIPTVLLPLLFVVSVDALFQMYEDMKRHKADTIANASPAVRYDPVSHSNVVCKWYELKVGDFVLIQSRETIPADIVILGTAEKSSPAQGICYVETKSLDGETNLKIRNALPNTLSNIRSIDDLLTLKGLVEMEHPNNLIDSFSGIIDLAGLGREPIGANNLLLRGCVLRNTDYVIGMVVNTGSDSKIMMSSSDTVGKTSHLESLASTQIQRIIMLLCLLSLCGAIGQTIWNNQNDISDISYLMWNPNAVGNFFVAFFYFLLLHATFIPVSLYVSMAVARFFQAVFMNSDEEMYYAPTDTPSSVGTMTLNEELGQISHIFSDKTGTLTCNIMDFRKMSIKGVKYGLGITEIGKASWKLQGKEVPQDVLEGEKQAQANAVDHVSFYDPKFELDNRVGMPQKVHIQKFFHILALCHDVIPERQNDVIRLSASNPDDEALVCAAKFFGYEFMDRRDKTAILFNSDSQKKEEVLVLESIAFSSKRKRMSVIVKDSEGIIWLYTKGADTVMFERFLTGQEAQIAAVTSDVASFSNEGLRCLLLGYSEILPDRFNKWHAAYRKACSDMTQIEKKKKGQVNDIEDLENAIETGLLLAGATAIEDKLQAGVPECIAEMAKAGINIWVLTGDKEETAINIAVACNLLLPKDYMVQVVINKKRGPNKEALLKLFRDAIEAFDLDNTLPRALVIDGPVLIVALSDEEIRDQLLLFSVRCKAVVCCRVSPDQKKEMVNLVKENIPGVRTLAIGDGANDVAMIQAAHVGVGIKGEEGLQAVNASDFAIAQFAYLSPLMLKHGRYNYIRMSNLVCYMFYKNVFMSTGQFWFNAACGVSGQKYYTEGAIQLFNVVFTSIPILLYAVYDRDMVVYNKKYPQLYQDGINNVYFSSFVFWVWIVHAVVESVLVALLPLAMLPKSDPFNGILNTFWEAGALAYTAIIIIVNFKMIFIQHRWYPFSVLMIVLSILSWFLLAYLINIVIWIDFEFYMLWNNLLGNPTFWLGLLLIVFIIFGKDLYMSALGRYFHPSNAQTLQSKEAFLFDTLDEFKAAAYSREMNLKVGKEVLLKTDGMTQDGVELVKPNRIEPNTVETRPMDKNIERNM